MQYFDQILYWLSAGLQIPVIVAVIWFLLQSLGLTGSLYGLYINRLRLKNKINKELEELNSENVFHLRNHIPQENQILSAKSILRLLDQGLTDIHREKVLNDFEMACQKDLDKSRTLSKMGPILGLMGTLIPMGPALAGLASGDIATMSQQMQVAFNTTVLGLVIGSIGFLSLQFKQRWYAEDLHNLEFIYSLISESDAQKK